MKQLILYILLSFCSIVNICLNAKIGYSVTIPETDKYIGYLTIIITVFEETWKEGEQAGRAEGRAEEIIAAGYEFGLSEKTILERLQKKLAITPQQAQEYLATYTKETEQRC